MQFRGNRPLHLARRLGRRDVDGFFEERPIEELGLVENRKYAQLTPGDHRFDRVLLPVDEAFDQQLVLQSAALRADFSTGEQSPYPVHRSLELTGVVGADHATAARQTKRL